MTADSDPEVYSADFDSIQVDFYLSNVSGLEKAIANNEVDTRVSNVKTYFSN